MQTTVTLADGGQVEVRRLALFELHDADIGPEDPGEFVYTISSVAGETYKAVYDLAENIKSPPPKPDNPDDVWAMTEYERFQAALAHHQHRLETLEQYSQNVADYILSHCVEPGVKSRLYDPDDYLKIYHAALCPMLSFEDLERVLNRTFPGLIQRDGDTGGDEADEGRPRVDGRDFAVGVSGDGGVADDRSGIQPAAVAGTGAAGGGPEVARLVGVSGE